MNEQRLEEIWRENLRKYNGNIKLDTIIIRSMQAACEELEANFKNLTIPAVVGASAEQLKAEVFTLANKLAVAGEGDAAVAMHRIHNRL